ncbi:hypothetical protein YPPY32_4189, partial [Yersinia pestis PY-32]
MATGFGTRNTSLTGR